MAKIDRLGWAAGTCLSAYGVRIGIRTNRPEVLAGIAPRLPPGCKPASTAIVDHLFSLWVGGSSRGSVKRYNLLYAGAGRRARSLSLDSVLDGLESELRLQVAAGAKRRVFVHAGVVAWRGRALVLPGSSHAGKTSLVAELLRAGATYYSDEFAVFDERGRVSPFAKPLAIRQDGVSRNVLPEALGSVAGAGSIPVGLIAFASYRPGARWSPARLTPGRGLLRLLGHTVPVRARPEAALAAFAPVVAEVPILAGPRGEAAATAGALLKRLERETAPGSRGRESKRRRA
jgi:hypothetical protein